MSRPNPLKELSADEAGVVEGGIARLSKAQFISRLWLKDARLWSPDRMRQKLVKNSLGWLSAPESMAAGLGVIRGFVSEVCQDDFRQAVVLGMGGSSLSCEVFRSCFATGKDSLKLDILDSTHPEAIAALEARLDLKKTLFIVSSKSGSTIEPNCLMEYFFEKVSRSNPRAGRQFTAITDPKTSLETLARRRSFRKIFTNPADVGGRYSALTYFGLVPAALMGIDVGLLLNRAREAARTFSPSRATSDNLALRLGAALGAHALNGQNKLTLSLSPEIEPLGLWIEQLVAESTGKEGKGIIPIGGEPLRKIASYGQDRLFVRLALAQAHDPQTQDRLFELERAGHPVISLRLRDLYDLGAQFFLWELATAAAGFLLGVNPFDQPDVQASKGRTQKILLSLKRGALPPQVPALYAGGLPASCDRKLSEALKKSHAQKSPHIPLREVLAAHLLRIKVGDYCAILAYADPGKTKVALDSIQKQLEDITRAPVLIQYGPRYLHSTGQLYKGGGADGLYLLLAESKAPALAIPGQPFGFGELCRAQAYGDFETLEACGRRILSLELGPPGSEPWKAISNALSEITGEKKPCPL
jgi:glucose-6-phosphate isomerase